MADPVAASPVVWLSIRQAVEFYGVSRRTIYNWLAAERLVTTRTPGGSIRIAIDRAQWHLSQEDRP